jgi:hypothetical protein
MNKINTMSTVQKQTSVQIMMNGKWVVYTPLEGIDPTFTSHQLYIGGLVYVHSLEQGKPYLEAHCAAEAAMFQQQS